MSTSTVIKRGDATVLLLDTLVNLSGAGYTSGQVFLVSGSTVVTKTVAVPTAPGTVLTCTLTSTDTAIVGDYNCEAQMTGGPGPHTYPTNGYALVQIVADLG